MQSKDGTAPAACAKPLKWRKIVRAILESRENSSLAERDLHARAWEIAALKGAGSKAESMLKLKKILKSSKQFVLSKGVVTLASPICGKAAAKLE